MPIFLGVVREGEQLSQLVVSVCPGSGGCYAVWSNTNVQTCEDISPTDRATVGHRPPARAATSHTFHIASIDLDILSNLLDTFCMKCKFHQMMPAENPDGDRDARTRKGWGWWWVAGVIFIKTRADRATIMFCTKRLKVVFNMCSRHKDL